MSLHQRHEMRELFEWLEMRPVGWADFFTYRADLQQEELRKRADERDRRRAEGLDPYFDDKLVPDDSFPKISDACPDCGSSDWKPIAYGLPTEDTGEDARRGHFVLGGCTFREPRRYCLSCFNRWPTKPDMSKPWGSPERIERQVVETRADYARLSALADQPACPEEPYVDRAWARIDGRIEFLVSLGKRKARITKTPGYARLGGGPTYETSMIFWVFDEHINRTRTLAAVAGLRYERTHEPEKHNLYNDWDKIQAYRREVDRRWDQNAYRRKRMKKNREKSSKLLKLARAAPERLPAILNFRSTGRDRRFRVRFPWGAVGLKGTSSRRLSRLIIAATRHAIKPKIPSLRKISPVRRRCLLNFQALPDKVALWLVRAWRRCISIPSRPETQLLCIVEVDMPSRRHLVLN